MPHSPHSKALSRILTKYPCPTLRRMAPLTDIRHTQRLSFTDAQSARKFPTGNFVSRIIGRLHLLYPCICFTYLPTHPPTLPALYLPYQLQTVKYGQLSWALDCRRRRKGRAEDLLARQCLTRCL